MKYERLESTDDLTQEAVIRGIAGKLVAAPFTEGKGLAVTVSATSGRAIYIGNEFRALKEPTVEVIVMKQNGVYTSIFPGNKGRLEVEAYRNWEAGIHCANILEQAIKEKNNLLKVPYDDIRPKSA